MWGGIEAGGTKFACLVGSGPDEICAEVSFPTQEPSTTLQRAVEFFQAYHTRAPLQAIGIGSFGPIDTNPQSPLYGYITTTPKRQWAHTNVVAPIQRAFRIPIGFDTDVNVAALGEYRWGAAQGVKTFMYLAVGTGIGGGGMVDDQFLHGLHHPEIGHMRIPHDKERDPYPGLCPFHGDCLEGLASGPAVEERWGTSCQSLPAEHPAWGLEAHYLALGLVNVILMLSPQRIILGGGVMEQSQLFSQIRNNVQELLKDYLALEEIQNAIETYIVPPGLGSRSGTLGAIALARVLTER